MTSPFVHLLAPFGVAPPAAASVDEAHLLSALGEARRGVGRTAPNPPVGAVVVKAGEVVGTGFHPKAGQRHGEIVALDVAGERARGATLYVTLEPCAHHGRTPPCVDRVLKEGVARVVVGAVDPNPLVHGKGIARLRDAGVIVDVLTGPVADACRALIQPFCRALVDKTPWVTLKVATSLDGRVAAKTGTARWITGASARGLVHALRDAVDVVLVGAGTVLADAPALTVRDVPGRNPRRVVVDGALRSSPAAAVFTCAADEPRPLVVHAAGASAERIAAFDAAGVARLTSSSSPHVDLAETLRALAGQGVTSVLVEAGPGLASALLAGALVDELWWLTAPVLLGADALPSVMPLGLSAPADGPRFTPVHHAIVGDDALVVLRR